MNFIALVKRVLPFFAGLAIGLIPSWIFTSSNSLTGDFAQPAFVKSRSYCDKTSKFRKEAETPAAISERLQILSKPRPGYTEAARAENTEGSVVLRVTFLASGSIGGVTPVKSLPDGLTEAAIEAAKQIEFKPATHYGQTVTITKQIEYTFSIY